MNSDADNDKALTDAWKSTQDLRAPEALNDAVLAEARKAAAAGDATGSWPWLKPMAFAATLLIGIFLVYDSQPPFEQTVMPARQQEISDSVLPAAPVTDAEGPVAELEERLDQEPSATTPAAIMRATPADIEAARERKSEADQARIQFKASADAAGDALDTFRDTANDRIAGSRAARSRAETQESAAVPAPFAAAAGCDEDQRRDAERWWDCVADLRSAGHLVAADREKASLLKAFPDFTVPE